MNFPFRIITELERVHRLHKSATTSSNLTIGSRSLSDGKIVDSPVSSTSLSAIELDSPISTVSELEWHELDPKQVDPRQLNIYKGLLLSVCYSASIGGTGTLMGTAPNLVLSDYINRQFTNATPLSFFAWFAFATPGMVILLILCWIWLQILYIGFE